MKQVKTGDLTRHNQGAKDWKPNVPFTTKPIITGQKRIGGVLHYISKEGKLFVAATFDRMFKTTPGKMVKANSKTGLIIKLN